MRRGPGSMGRREVRNSRVKAEGRKPETRRAKAGNPKAEGRRPKEARNPKGESRSASGFGMVLSQRPPPPTQGSSARSAMFIAMTTPGGPAKLRRSGMDGCRRYKQAAPWRTGGCAWLGLLLAFGFRTSKLGSSGCRINPAFRWWYQESPHPSIMRIVANAGFLPTDNNGVS